MDNDKKTKEEAQPNGEAGVEKKEDASEEGDKLKQQMEKLEAEKKTYREGWQKARADLINFKQEEAQRFKEMVDYALEGQALKIIAVIDSFEMAERYLKEEQKKDPNVQGLLLAKKQLLDILKAQGIEPRDFLGKPADHNFCSIEAEVATEGSPPGTVVEEILRAYVAHGAALRPARVKIAK